MTPTTHNPELSNVAIAPNAKRLLWAGFMAILAAGVGFSIRGGILGIWSATFGFTGLETGLINGAGFTGFCFGIIIGGLIADKIGYGKLVIVAFALHLLSAFVTFAPSAGMASRTAFVYLWSGTFIFALANGTLEAVANPLVATLFPQNRTHYLNILHASWPAGLVLGSFIGGYWGETLGWGWKTRLALFLIPTAIYGIMFLGQHFPKSEASQKGLKLGEMLSDVGIIGSAVVGFLVGLFFKDGLGPLLGGLTNSAFFSSNAWIYISIAVGAAVWLSLSNLSRWAMGAWLLFTLFIAHALVGAVELGTDGWIQNITGNILTTKQGTLLFVFTSAVMFSLRFCADFIEKRIGLSPLGILLTCAILACIGLNLASGIAAFGGAMGALLVYAVGKTFFWPTMLAVASDRFPRTGAVAISIMGGIGMMSAGLIGSPGLGYAKDRFASEALQNNDAQVYAANKVAEPKGWLIFKPVNAIDGKKLGEVQQKLQTARAELAKTGVADPKAALDKLTPEERAIYEGSIQGDRKTLKADSFIPATMAVMYLLILLYFKSIGGYKPVHIVPVTEQQAAEAKVV
jgi:MFS family permease